METYISLRLDSSYIRSIVRTRRRWLSKYTLSDKVSCIFTLVLFMVICINREVECSRLNGAFASPCYRLDGQNKPILDKPQVSNNKIKLKNVLYTNFSFLRWKLNNIIFRLDFWNKIIFCTILSFIRFLHL